MTRERIAIPELEASRCLACGSDRLSLVETVPVRALAEAWETEVRVHVGAKLTRDACRPLVETLGSDAVRFDRCAECGLEMGSPRRSWLEGAYQGAQDYPLRWEFERFLNDLDATSATLLEIGCGSGAFLRMARDRGHKVLGMDFNHEGVAEAQRRGFHVLPGGFDHLRDHIAARGLEPTFQAIAMFQVIEHLTDPSAVFEDLATFAGPGTKLGISCPGPRRFTQLIREEQVGARDFWDYPPHHVMRWTLPALRRFLEARGWRIVRAMEEPLFWLGASSHVAIARAMRRGYVSDPIRRSLGIARAMVQLLGRLGGVKGVSIYTCAERTAEQR
jgi:SAM-dependent methyltransferase